MSQRGVEALLGRMVTDKDFRQRFYQEPAATCVVETMEVTTRELESILAVDETEVADFAKHLDTRIVRASVNGELRHTVPAAGLASEQRNQDVEEPVTRTKQQRLR